MICHIHSHTSTHTHPLALSSLADLIKKRSIDDKADKEEPSAAQATGGGRKAYSRKLQGIQDEGRRLSYVSTIELGGGSKDTALEIAQDILHVITTAMQQRISLTTRDCASLGYAGTNIAPISVACLSSTQIASSLISSARASTSRSMASARLTTSSD